MQSAKCKMQSLNTVALIFDFELNFCILRFDFCFYFKKAM